MPRDLLSSNVPKKGDDDSSLLAPANYDEDASSLHERSDQDTDSEDDELMAAARNSRELLARDRLVLMDEEEMDQLVLNSRKEERRKRRHSGLPVPNLSHMFRNSSRNRSSSTIESKEEEKRRARRERRRMRREQLMKDAQHGEDAELMYEMESGGMKDGSSTGDSSEREGSDELDRQHLMRAGSRIQQRRRWRKWVFIHTTIAVGFAFLVLLAWKLSKNRRGITSELVSNGTALFGPTTLMISLDGFRADFLQRGLTPRLNAFIKEGVSPLYMLPSFPSVTFPNHYTIATGLYPESHGVVGNSFWDPDLEAEFYYTDPKRSLDPKWWGGEPFWVTAEKQGVRTAVHMWPGSEAHVLGVEPSFLDKYNGKEKLPKKAARILEFLDKPGMENPTANVKDMRPQIIAAYVPNIDASGHLNGPNSTEIRTTISQVDTMLDEIFQGLEERNLTHIVNVIIVSDHGMATTDVTRMVQLDGLLDMSKVGHLDGWPLVGIRPKDPADLQLLYNQALSKANSSIGFDVYLKDQDMPDRWHFSDNDRIAPLWIIPKAGWAIVTKEEFDIEDAKSKGLVYHPRGLHGYDHEHPLMRAIFIARGPAFPHQPNSKLDPFQNIEVYNMLCDSVGLTPIPNNGTVRLPLTPVGLHDPEITIETPPDPEPTATTEDEAAGVINISPIETSSAANEHEHPPSAVGVDPVDEQPPAEHGEAPEAGSRLQFLKDYWDWLKGKAGDLWNEATGPEA